MSNRDAMEGLDPRALLREGLAGEGERGVELDREEERRVRELVARHLPDIEVLELIGRGGMGYVYRARQRRLEREVALKVLAPELGERPDFAERFAREAKAMARLNHPHIASVFDYGQVGALCYLVLELVSGTSLREVMRSGKLSPAEALAIVPAICAALQYAHDEGVVHRDVKPENILLDREGRVKIVDFGLAKLVGTPAALVSLTGSQQVLGTLRYMAPEQLDRPLEVDHRADIYSLGVVFYEMLTGEIPMGRFDPPSKHEGVDVRLDDIVLRTLEKEPDRRYQRVEDVGTDVEHVSYVPRGEGVVSSARGADAPAASAGPGDRPRARLSKLALAAPLLLGVSALPPLLGFLVAQSMARSVQIARALDPDGPLAVSDLGGGAGRVLVVLSGLLSVLLFGLACLLGWMALGRLRRAWPRFYGVGGAMLAAWLLPLAVINVLLAAVINVPIDIVGRIPTWLPAVEVPVLVVADVCFLVWYRGWFVRRCESETARPFEVP